MGNQQPNTLEERIYFLAKNALFGDGHLWRHPECKNYKMVYTSTTPELLESKKALAPEIFSVEVKLTKTGRGRFENAKPLYTLASRVHPIITEVKMRLKESFYKELTIEDFGLWYLDDGGLQRRHDGGYKSFRYVLSIGDCCETEEKLGLFTSRLQELFGNKWGSIHKNNSKATEKNKVWLIPHPIATVILAEARKYGVLAYKFPDGEGSETIS